MKNCDDRFKRHRIVSCHPTGLFRESILWTKAVMKMPNPGGIGDPLLGCTDAGQFTLKLSEFIVLPGRFE